MNVIWLFLGCGYKVGKKEVKKREVSLTYNLPKTMIRIYGTYTYIYDSIKKKREYKDINYNVELLTKADPYCYYGYNFKKKWIRNVEKKLQFTQDGRLLSTDHSSVSNVGDVLKNLAYMGAGVAGALIHTGITGDLPKPFATEGEELENGQDNNEPKDKTGKIEERKEEFSFLLNISDLPKTDILKNPITFVNTSHPLISNGQIIEFLKKDLKFIIFSRDLPKINEIKYQKKGKKFKGILIRRPRSVELSFYRIEDDTAVLQKRDIVPVLDESSPFDFCYMNSWGPFKTVRNLKFNPNGSLQEFYNQEESKMDKLSSTIRETPEEMRSGLEKVYELMEAKHKVDLQKIENKKALEEAKKE
jgi:hypothetical protein